MQMNNTQVESGVWVSYTCTALLMWEIGRIQLQAMRMTSFLLALQRSMAQCTTPLDNKRALCLIDLTVCVFDLQMPRRGLVAVTHVYMDWQIILQQKTDDENASYCCLEPAGKNAVEVTHLLNTKCSERDAAYAAANCK